MVQIPEDAQKPITQRLKRAHGQIGAVIRMIEEGYDCEEIVTQLSAANKAISRAAYALIASGLDECYKNAGSSKDVDLKKLEKLFLSLA